jgi:hypothetical protein
MGRLTPNLAKTDLCRQLGYSFRNGRHGLWLTLVPRCLLASRTTSWPEARDSVAAGSSGAPPAGAAAHTASAARSMDENKTAQM